MRKPGGQSDSKAMVGAIVDGAEVVPIKGRGRAPAPAPDARDDPRPEPPPHDAEGGQDGHRDGGGFLQLLGDDCPVVPLGTSQGVYFYLSSLRELRPLKAKEHDGRNILSLFAPRTSSLHEIFPRYGKAKKADGSPAVTGWDKEGAGEKLMNACAERGVWTAEGRVRGAGAHRDTDGGLVVHCGDMILIPDVPVQGDLLGWPYTWAHPGLIDGLVYPAAPKTPRPWVEAVGPDVAQRLLALLGSWQWERPDISPRLALGWIGAAMVCGALDWRPAMWVTGGKGTGKSTFQKLLKYLMGDNGLIEAVDATEAYIRQLLGHRTLPVALDELEAEADDRKQRAIIKLARLASSGGKMGRGGSDHNPHEFTARSSFLFSSILTVPLTPQDKSRMAVLDLLPLAEDALPPAIDAKGYGEIGRKLRRRMVDQWHRLDAVLDGYRAELAKNGLDARGQDQMGALLACGDLLLYDFDADAEDEEYANWGRALAVDKTEAHEDDEPFLCIQRMATTALAGRGGDLPETTSMWIAKVIDPEADELPVSGAQKRLEMAGLLVVSSMVAEATPAEPAPTRVTRRWKGGGWPKHASSPALFVAVAARHQGLELLLRDTRWQGGVWNQALGRLPGAVKRVAVRIGSKKEWVTLVPIAAFVSAEEESE